MFNVFKAGNPLGVHKCYIFWVAKENGNNPHKNPVRQTFKNCCQGLAAPFTLVCVHLFSPMLVNFVSFQFLSLGTVGIRDSVLRLMKCVPRAESPVSLQEIILTQRSQLF